MQPRILLPLRSYQLTAVNFLVEHRRAYLADVMGLGKSIVALTALHQLEARDFVVFAPKSAMGVWRDELWKWYQQPATILTGNQQQRAQILDAYHGGPLITSYSQAETVANYRRRWDAIVLDEAHTLRNRGTKMLRAVNQLRSPTLFCLSGTPIVNHAMDLWPLLHLIDPQFPLFRSYWRFASEFCVVYRDEYGTHIGGVSKPVYLRTLLKSYLLRRTDKQVLAQLPPITRQSIPLTLEGTQREAYLLLARTMEAQYPGNADGNIILTPNVIAQIVRLRQLLVTPRLLWDNAPRGACLDALADYLRADLANNRNVVIFTPFAAAIPHIGEIVKDLGYDFAMLYGGLSQAHFDRTLAKCQDDRVRVLIASLGISQGYSATFAQSAYFVGFDWTPAMNLQAEARLHRIGQTNPVYVRYFVHRDSVDEYVLAALNRKTAIDEVSLPLSVMRLEGMGGDVVDLATGVL